MHRFFLLFFFLPIISWGQSFYNISFNIADGLASNHVFCAFQDSQGYMWFGTDQGVSRFDGIAFENFDIGDGLSDNSVFSIMEDSQSRIWFATFDGRPCYYQGGKFYNPNNSPFLKGLQLDDFTQLMFEDAVGNIWLGGRKSYVYRIPPKGEVAVFEVDQSIRAAYDEKSGPVFLDAWGIQFRPDDSLGRLIFDEQAFAAVERKKDDVVEAARLLSKTVYHPELNMFFSVHVFTSLLNWGVILEEVQSAEFENYTWVNFGQKTNKGLWITHVNGALYFEVGKAGELVPGREISFPGEEVSHVLQDLSGNFWISTLSNGVHFLPQNPKINTEFTGQYVNDLHLGWDNEVWYSTDHSNIGVLHRRNTLLPKIQDERRENRVSFQFNEDSLYTWFTTPEVSGRLGYPDSVFLFPFMGNSLLLQRSGLLSGSANWLLKFNWPLRQAEDFPRDIREMAVDTLLENRVIQLEPIDDDSAVVVSTLGVLMANQDTITPLDTPLPIDRVKGVATMRILDETWLWFYSQNEFCGLAPDGHIVLSLEEIPIEGVQFSEMLPLGDSLVLLASNKGLWVFEFDRSEVSVFYRKQVGEFQGLYGKKINDLLVNEDSLYVATDLGLSYFPLDLLEKKDKEDSPIPLIKSIAVNGIPYQLTPELTLDDDENNIRITHTGIHFPSLGGISFRYRINQGDWNMVESQTVQLVDLSPGSYVYEMQARSLLAGWSTESATFRFSIRRSMWQTTGFMVLGALLLSALIGVGVVFRIQQIKQKVQLRELASQMELRALKAQMSPHFIFNVLSSIQRYVLANNPKLANEYLTKFSRLTRRILSNSDKTTVSLEEEIESLKLYIELEQLRLSHRFSYVIDVDLGLNPERVELPPLFLQTFVENAIWHGLSPMDGGGILELSFQREGSFLHAVVRDNGIGRAAARIRNPRVGVSKGLRLTLDKLKVLNNTLYGQRATVKVLDLTNEDGFASGTEVHFKVPL